MKEMINQPRSEGKNTINFKLVENNGKKND